MEDLNLNLAAVEELRDVVRAVARIYANVQVAVGDDAAQEAFDLALAALDDDDPSVSDLEELAEQVDVDLSDLLDADGGADAGGGSGDDAAAAAANSSVTLTVNTRRVAEAHGLPTDWYALDGIDLPPSLADATLDDRGLAAAINRAQGWDTSKGEGVSPGRVGGVRDKGGFDDDLGASASAFDDADAGLNSDLDEEHPLPPSTVRQYVSRHLSKTGRHANLNSQDSFGVGLDDVDGE